MLFLGIIFLAIGGYGFYAHNKKREAIYHMKLAENRKIGDLASLSKEVADELGEGGSFNEFLDVSGKLVCQAPLRSELSKTPCIYYKFEVSREYEETIDVYDEQSKQHRRRTTRSSEIISSNHRRCEFAVDDGSGQMIVIPDGADIDADKSLDKFQNSRGRQLTYGDFSMQVPSLSSGRRLIGFRFREWVVPLGRQIYVMGEASDAGGRLAIRRPSDTSKSFVISLRSEAELIRAAEGSMKLMKFVGYGGIGLGVAAIIVSFF